MSANFSERLAELPGNLANHLMLTVIALLAGVLVSVPTAIWLVKRRGLRYPILTGAGVIQTIPSLALLALMVPILDKTGGLGLGLAPFGFYPAVIALTLYSLLPILRNTVTGILSVDASLTEAARGLGMTPRQILCKVEMPLAAPVIIAGIRTAAVWVVGIATLSTPVGQRSLGNYIFTGLQTRNWTMLMFGVVLAALLAIILDTLIGGVQKSVEDRRKRLGVFAAGGLAFVCIGGLLSPQIASWMRPSAAAAPSQFTAEGEVEQERRVIRIGSKTFTEQYILAALLEDVLRRAGFETQRKDSLGSIVIFNALASSEIDVYVEYTGTVWANTMKREDVPSPWRVYTEMSAALAETHDIRTLGRLGFENAYALAMRRAHAEEFSMTRISDLAEHAPKLSIGGDYEFFGRPEWTQMRDVYGLNFGQRTSYDSTLMYEAAALGEVDVISAFSTDGRIAAYDLLVLEDDRHVVPPYDAVILLGPSIADREDVADALAPLLNAITPDLMREANLLVDRDEDRRTVREAAGWLRDSIESRREAATE